MIDRAVSRRAFLKTAGVATLGVGLAACRPLPPIDDPAIEGDEETGSPKLGYAVAPRSAGQTRKGRKERQNVSCFDLC